MALDNFLEWSITAASNIDVAGINIQNTGLVSQGDDAMRAIMAWAAQNDRTITYLMDTATFDLRGSNIATSKLVISGTATVTTVNLEDTQIRWARIESQRTFTAGANLIINGSSTISFVCPAEAIVMFIGGASSVVRMYTFISHGSRTTAKAWLRFNGSGTPTASISHNLSSITDNAVGSWGINFTTAFSSAAYVCSTGMNTMDASTQQQIDANCASASQATIRYFNNGAAFDSTQMFASFFGVQ